MKNKLLSLLLLSVLVVSTFAVYGANAGTLQEATVYSNDFESDNAGYTITSHINTDYDGSWGIDPSNGVDGSKCFFLQSQNYGNAVTNTLIDNLDANKTYRLSFKAKGDISQLKIANSAVQPATFETVIDIGNKIGTLERDYKAYSVDFTGQTGIKLWLKVQATSSILNGTLYIDDINIYDVELMPTAEPETPSPTPALDESTPTPITTETPENTPNTTPITVPTPSPSEVVIGPCPPFTYVKFIPKSVTLKKGKKKVLKLKITGTGAKNVKKAKFSVNKKKILKLVKKKAKSVTVKGIKKGKAIVTAKVDRKTVKCKVTVRK